MKTQQTGRSMVEMLGVLAIIAVLSAGALAGYSKAMFRHKMNQTIDEATKIFQRFEEIKDKDWGGTPQNVVWIDSPEAAVNFGLIEKCDNITSFNGIRACKLPIAHVSFDLGQGDVSCVGDNGSYGYIEFTFTDTKSCNAFLSTHWEQILPVDWWNNGSTIRAWPQHNDDTIYSQNTSPLTIERISQACSDCLTKNSNLGFCTIIFTYRTYC